MLHVSQAPLCNTYSMLPILAFMPFKCMRYPEHCVMAGSEKAFGAKGEEDLRQLWAGSRGVTKLFLPVLGLKAVTIHPEDWTACSQSQEFDERAQRKALVSGR